jgi:hypothetical protein
LVCLAVAAFAIGGQSIPIFLEYQAIRKKAIEKPRGKARCLVCARLLIARCD